jgi:probable phosphoglycerate mutase
VRLILVRHGQSHHNVTGTLDTAIPGAELTALGHAQARALPRALVDEDISAVYASRLVRTQMTAAPLAAARGLEVQVQPGLEEIPAGALELRADDDAVRAYTDCLVHWMGSGRDRRVPGGESRSQFLDRYGRALRAITDRHHPTDTVAVVSHGAAIRVYVAATTTLDVADPTQMWVMNTGAAVLEGDPVTGWEVRCWHHEPLGGADLDDHDGRDVMGDPPGALLDR